MAKIEKPPSVKGKALQKKAGHLLLQPEVIKLIKGINDEYLYYNKVKYKLTEKVSDPVLLWAMVKQSRSVGARNISFGKYRLSYNLMGNIERLLHEFDLHLGGRLTSSGLVPEEDKRNYLISSIMEEAIASSQIEGAVTTRKEAKEMLRKNRKPRTKSEQMIINNYQTIRHIVDNRGQKLEEAGLLEIHRLVCHQTMEEDADEGRFREDDEVNVVDIIDGDIIHIPPSVNELPALMDDLYRFFNDEEQGDFIHPIIKACIIHFMVGFIHPFSDGNGRTARALFYWYLLRKQYWLMEYISISRMIKQSKGQYSKAFLYTENDELDLTYFILYNVKTVQQAFESLKKYIDRKLKEKQQQKTFQKLGGINDRQAMILHWMQEEPDTLLTVKEIETRFMISNQSARNDLSNLVEQGYLRQVAVDKKSKVFVRAENFDKLISG